MNTLEQATNIVEKYRDNLKYTDEDNVLHPVSIEICEDTTDVRLHNLPPELDNNIISTFLRSYGQVANIKNEIWSNNVRFQVPSGVRCVKINMKTPIPSYVTIEGHQTLVTYPGQEQTCVYCNETGHKGTDCSKKPPKKKWNLNNHRPQIEPTQPQQTQEQNQIQHTSQLTNNTTHYPPIINQEPGKDQIQPNTNRIPNAPKQTQILTPPVSKRLIQDSSSDNEMPNLLDQNDLPSSSNKNQDNEKDNEKRKIKKQRGTSPGEKIPIKTLIQPLRKEMNKHPEEYSLTHEELEELLENIQGSKDPISIIEQFTDDVPDLARTFLKLRAKADTQTLKYRLTKLTNQIKDHMRTQNKNFSSIESLPTEN